MQDKVYTSIEIGEIRQIIRTGILQGLSRMKITQSVHGQYPVNGVNIPKALEIIREIYDEEIVSFQNVLKADMNAVLERSLSRYEELYEIAMETKDYKMAKSVLDSLLKLTSVDKMKSLTEKDKDTNCEFHLDFGL